MNNSQHWRKSSLLRQITLLVLLTTTVLLIFFGWQRIQVETGRLTQNLQVTLETNSRWLATALSLPLYNYDDATVTAICNSLLSHPDIVQVVVRANERTDFYPRGEIEAIEKAPDGYISIDRHVTHQGIILGDIKVYMSTKNLREQIRSVTTISLIQIVVLDIFLVAALIFFISRTFIKPMEQLRHASGEIADGNLQHTIAIQSNNELGLLATNLETMRISMLEKISALETEVEVRKNVEAELVQAKSYIDNIVNSMPSLLVSVDCSLKITQWNKEAELRCGVPSSEAVGHRIDEVCDRLSGEQDKILEAMNRCQVLYDVARGSSSGDDDRYEDVTIYPLEGQQGVVGAVVRIDDVTAEFNLRNELAHSRKLDAIGQLAGGIAHDFNNMLGGVLGGAELLGRRVFDDEKAVQYLDIITQSGNRAAELTEKLLAFARKGKMQSVAVDVAVAVDEAATILQHTIDKRINVNVEIATDRTTVIGDLSQLQNALINLGINAGHAMPEGGELDYRLGLTSLDERYCQTSPFDISPGDYIDIEIHDTGEGIPADVLPKIFEPFFTTKRQGEGTGLGLAAVYGTVQEHHGAIIVYSELGRGTAFHIYLPAVDRRVSARDDVKEEIISGSGTILVVDDEAVIRITARETLETLGYSVILANNGREGLDIFTAEADQIDLVLMDMLMPEMSGSESFYAMQKISPSVKVILASGFSRGADLEKLTADGLCGFLAKPYTAVALSKIIADALAEGSPS